MLAHVTIKKPEPTQMVLLNRQDFLRHTYLHVNYDAMFLYIIPFFCK